MKKRVMSVLIMLGILGLLAAMPFSGYGADLTIGNSSITGTGPMTLTGALSATSFGGDGAGLTNLDPTKLSSGTAGISISGNAATATTANSVASGVVAAAGLASGAVTPAKISFYNKVAVVAASGGNYNKPTDAMNNLATWCPSPSHSTPCLLKIMPGEYDIGTNTVLMNPYVDIEGSGENVTFIQGHPDGPANVLGASNAEIRFLTVTNYGGGPNTNAVAIGNIAVSGSITHVTALASGATYNHAIENHSGASPLMKDVTAYAYGAGTDNVGVLNDSSAAPGMLNCIANASGGTNNTGIKNLSAGTIMKNVVASADGGTTSTAILNDAFTGRLDDVMADASNATNTNGIVSQNSNGGQMFFILATASNGTTNIGILNQSGAKPSMGRVRGEGSGGTTSIGVKNDSCGGNGQWTINGVSGIGHNATGTNTGFLNHSCSLIMLSANASALPGKAGAVHNAIYNDAASPRIQSSLIIAPTDSASCAGGCYGVNNVTSGTAAIDNSQIYAYSNTISNGTNVTTYVGNTKLEGGAVSNTGTLLKCIGVYNSSYNALNSSCQ